MLHLLDKIACTYILYAIYQLLYLWKNIRPSHGTTIDHIYQYEFKPYYVALGWSWLIDDNT